IPLLAFCSTSSETMASHPFSAAWCSAVRPELSLASLSIFRPRNSRVASASPFWAEIIKGVFRSS
ncbi:hypothetical protein BDD12DRAFT_825255, partial [Trichophaea hybrida]